MSEEVEPSLIEDLLKMLPGVDVQAASMNRRIILSEMKLRVLGATDADISSLRAVREVRP